MRHDLLVGLAAAVVLAVAAEGDAQACGGCFSPPTQNGTVVTDHRMIFAISQEQTTLYDEIEYQGSPASFAWVLPIQGPVTVGLSADTLFTALDQATATTIVPPQRNSCPSCACGGFSSGPSAANAAVDAGAVTVISQQVVGPYETVQLKSTDPNALNAWLTANGYSVPANVMPVIAAYVNEGFDFLALRLVPGQGVSAMRPVSVTSPGAGLSLPLRMVAAGTGSTVGITLWVVGDGRYEPKNFLQFLVSPSELVWDFSTNLSNYTTLQAQKERGLKNAAWQIESSLSISPYQIESAVLSDPSATGYAAIPAANTGAADGGGIAGESADKVREQDLATLFAAGPQTTRITRMRADLSQAALATDLVLQASENQGLLSNIYQVPQPTAPVCPPYDPAQCNCGNGAGNGGSSGNGVDGDGGFGGSGSAASGSAASGSAGANSGDGPRSTASGCAIGPAGHAGDPDIDFALAGLVGVALVRTLKKKR